MGTGQEAFFSADLHQDNVDVAGQPSMAPTRWGCGRRLRPEDNGVVLGAGLVSLGKTQLSNSASAPWPDTLGWDRSVIRGPPTTQRVPPRDQAPNLAAGVVSRTPTTAAARSVFPAACRLVGLKPSRGRTPAGAR